MRKVRRYDGVTAFTGMPGSGKTYALAEVAARARRRGVPVWCNEGFNIAGCVEDGTIFDSFEGFLAIPNGSVVVWDELPIYVNARKWQEFPDGLLYRLTQVRKDGLRFYYSAIDEDMVDVTVRRLTFWYWHCQAITQRMLRRQLWPPEKYRKAKTRPYRKELVRVNLAIARTYDTHAKVAAPVAAQSVKAGPAWVVHNAGDVGGSNGVSSAAGATSPADGRRREAPTPAMDLAAAELVSGEAQWGRIKRIG